MTSTGETVEWGDLPGAEQINARTLEVRCGQASPADRPAVRTATMQVADDRTLEKYGEVAVAPW
jgi:hypothetical protein